MKSNKEYHFSNNIKSVTDVVGALRDAGYVVLYYRKCGLEGRTICHRIIFDSMRREYQVLDLEDCLKFIVSDATILGKLVDFGTITEA